MLPLTHQHLLHIQFLQGLEGPKFTVLKKIGDNIELRRYEPGGCWRPATAQAATLSYEPAVTAACPVAAAATAAGGVACFP
jgi:hypothetical protein